jgi:cobalt-zinc-cadmium efflux system membrane fusion protein
MKTLLSIVLLIFILLAGCKRAPEQPQPAATQPASPAVVDHEEEPGILHVKPEMLRDLKVTTAEVESRPAGEASMLLGELRVNENRYAEVGAPISSRVVALHAGVTDGAQEGQVLATLQSAELGKARAAVIAAKARLDLANQTLERKRRLHAERIVAEREVQEAQANATAAEAELRAAQASLRVLGAGGDEPSDTSLYSLRSPVSGTVIERNAVKGQMVDAEEVLFKVADLSSLWLTVQAFERDALRIRPGSQVRIIFPAIPGTSYNAKVDLVGKQVNPDSRTMSVRVVIQNRDGRLRPGMSASAWVTPGDDAATTITVPAAALQRLGEDWVVFIPQPKRGEFEVRKVGRGRDLGGEIEIISGLAARERVVVDGAFLLKAEAEKARGAGAEHKH